METKDVELTNQAENEAFFDSQRVMVVTQTQYRSFGKEGETVVYRTRGEEVLRMARLAREAGCQVMIFDDGSSEEFVKELDRKGKELDFRVIQAEVTGMSPGRRLLFSEAAKIPGVAAIYWTEEKSGLF